ncbi:uncharacterized protein TNCV_742231 [Trichonephila clavipes]|nr:uncharacterized protein TNCV_742231 [Trichonephila clavipes]
MSMRIGTKLGSFATWDFIIRTIVGLGVTSVTAAVKLCKFQRGLIIGRKNAGWSTCRVAGQVDRLECVVRNCWEQWTREGIHAWKTGSGATRETTRREDRRIVRQALVDLTVTRSTIRVDVGVAIASQTISRHLAEANLKS